VVVVEIMRSFQTTLVIQEGLEVELQEQRQVLEQSVQVFNQLSLNQQVVQIMETMAEAETETPAVHRVAEVAALGE